MDMKKELTEEEKRNIEENEYKVAMDSIEKLKRIIREGKIPKATRRADKQFIETIIRIILEGEISTCDVRTRWLDGTVARYMSYFGVTNRYDNIEEDFPVLTIRDNAKQFVKSLNEINWIYFMKSNNVKDLNSKIWDQWADENGSIGKAYGYEIGQKFPVKKRDGQIEMMDQMENVVYLLTHDPESRRIITEMFKNEHLTEAALPSCAHGTQWEIKNGKLYMDLSQRSQDMLTANGWNLMQYAGFLCYMAKALNLKVGGIVHHIVDCHIYLRHLPQIVKLFEEGDCKDIQVKLKINKDIVDPLKDFDENDFVLENYEASNVKIGKIEVAI